MRSAPAGGLGASTGCRVAGCGTCTENECERTHLDCALPGLTRRPQASARADVFGSGRIAGAPYGRAESGHSLRDAPPPLPAYVNPVEAYMLKMRSYMIAAFDLEDGSGSEAGEGGGQREVADRVRRLQRTSFVRYEDLVRKPAAVMGWLVSRGVWGGSSSRHPTLPPTHPPLPKPSPTTPESPPSPPPRPPPSLP